MNDPKNGHLVLRTSVLKGRNLAAKDKGGTSDPVSAPQCHLSRPTCTRGPQHELTVRN